MQNQIFTVRFALLVTASLLPGCWERFSTKSSPAPTHATGTNQSVSVTTTTAKIQTSNTVAPAAAPQTGFLPKQRTYQAQITNDIRPDFRSFTGNISRSPKPYGHQGYSFDLVTRSQTRWGSDFAVMNSTAISNRGLQLGFESSGAIHSIFDYQLGELLAPYPYSAAAGGDAVDWVLQTNYWYSEALYGYDTPGFPGHRKPPIMQLAGSGSPEEQSLTNRPTFSPLFWAYADPVEKSYTTLTWPLPDLPNTAQLANMPRPAGVFDLQIAKNLGEQVMEIIHVAYNPGTRPVVGTNEWLVTNALRLPVTFFGNADGKRTKYQIVSQQAAGGGLSSNSWLINDHPWHGFLNVSDDIISARGLGLIFGQSTNDRYPTGELLTAGGSSVVTNTSGGYATSNSYNIDLKPGWAMYHRYYLVADWASNLSSRAIELLPYTAQGLMQKPKQALLKPVCQTGWEFRGCASNEKPSFYAMANWAVGAQPLLKLRNAFTNAPYLATTPYGVSDDAPFNNSTMFEGFLGWGPVNATDGLFSDCYDWVKLRELIPNGHYIRDGFSEDVWVIRTPTVTVGACDGRDRVH